MVHPQGGACIAALYRVLLGPVHNPCISQVVQALQLMSHMLLQNAHCNRQLPPGQPCTLVQGVCLCFRRAI